MSARVRAAIEQARAHQKFWDQPRRGDDVYIAMGDSAGLGVGSPDPLKGYVGLLSDRLAERTGRSIRVINFCVSGEKARDVLWRQVPRLEREPAPDYLTCIVGGNDVAFTRRWDQSAFRGTMQEIAAALPSHAVLGLVPSFGRLPVFERRVRMANRAIREVGSEFGLDVADIYTPTRAQGFRQHLANLSPDFFHPNADGYRLWADAIWPLIDPGRPGEETARQDD